MPENTAPASVLTHQQRLAAKKRWLVDEGNNIGRLAGDKKEWKSQINLLAEAAAGESEPRVLLNLLRYQQARNKEAWQGVANPLFEGMTACITEAGDDDTLAILLIRHLFLYSNRAYTFARYQSNGDQP
jgi:hypothetical protein